MIRQRDFLNKIDFAVAEGVCGRCTLLPPRRCHYRRSSSLPQDGARTKSDGLEPPSADKSANLGDGEYEEKDSKNNLAMCRKICSFAPQITPFSFPPSKSPVPQQIMSWNKTGVKTSVSAIQKRSIVSRFYSLNSRPNFLLTTGIKKRSYMNGAVENVLSVTKPSLPQSESILHNSSSQMKIRNHLKIWQEKLTKSTVQEDFNPLRLNSHEEAFQHDLGSGTFSTDEAFALSDDPVYLRPGDVVDLSNNDEQILAVYVRGFTNQSQFYTMYGRWLHRHSAHAIFAIEQMIPPEDLRSIHPYLPKDEIPVENLDKLHSLSLAVPREAGAEIIEKLTAFFRSTNEIIRMNSRRLDHIHDIVAHPTETTFGLLQEIAQKIMQKNNPADLTDPMLWAVHKKVLENPYFRPTMRRKHRLYPLFSIPSKADVKSVEEVRNWAREYQEADNDDVHKARLTSQLRPNPFHGFVKTAQAIIRNSRKTRMISPSGAIGPSTVRVEPTPPSWAVCKQSFLSHGGRAEKSLASNEGVVTSFTREESQIIYFLYFWASLSSIKYKSALSSLGPMIIRATKMYDCLPLGHSTGNLLLQELGMLPPWFDRIPYAQNLQLPHHELSSLPTRLFQKAQTSAQDFHLVDSMEGLRKDWGDLPVFCIDDASAREIDDGVSLEEIDETTSWIHVHVANPSAYLTPTSAMAQYAAHLTETVYLPGVRYPMFPPEIIQKYFSLTKNRPCITFSTKLTTDGHVLEMQISHGIIRNVVSITYDSLDSVLESEIVSAGTKLTVGGEMTWNSSQSKSPPLSPWQTNLLNKLCDLTAARCRKMEQKGAIPPIYTPIGAGIEVYLDQTNSKESLCPSQGLIRKTRVQGSQYEGDPIIIMSAEQSGETVRSKPSLRELIARVMTLAGEVGASWCAKRNIPITYRGTARRVDPPESPKVFRRDVLDPFYAENGTIPIGMLVHYTRLLGQTTSYSTPKQHMLLGTDGYARLTSPLRRYPDLMAHWQIEAAIRQESQIGISLIGSVDDSYLPFSRSQVCSIIQRNSARENMIMEAKQFSKRHWTTQLFHRAFYYKEAPLPETFEVAIKWESNTGSLTQVGWVKKYDFAFHLPENDVTLRDGGIKAGDCWEAKIDHVDAFSATISGSAIRLLERTDNRPW